MKAFLRAGSALVAVLALGLAAGEARADTFTLDSVGNLNDPFGQCHNDKCACGGIQIDWDGLGFTTGNPHGALHINNLTISMTSQTGSFGGLHKEPGNVHQSAAISLASGPGATFQSGPHVWTNILSMSLVSVGDAQFRGKQLRPLCQDFVLTIVTTQGNYVFDLCSIQGSQVNFNRAGCVTALNFRFCATLVSQPGGPPPVPEPTSLLVLGLGGLGLASRLRKRCAVAS